MIARLAKAVLVLPGTVLVLVPALIIWSTRDTALEAQPAALDEVRFWLAVIAGGAGLLLAIWTTRLFVTAGEGTPAPWDPPQRLVVLGPYRHVRNPMITAVLLILAGEALLLGSWALLGWLVVFFAANALYFPLHEEKALEARFGEAYRRYKANVPRWLPRLSPWHER